MSRPKLTSERWYQNFFSPEYWALAAHEYTVERTQSELEYLLSVLKKVGRGGRIADLGCGLGRHALGLARQGFDVIGLDVSSWALEQAGERSEAEGLAIEWRRHDLLYENDWPGAEIDAAICVQSFGWGSDEDQLRFLRQVRRSLRSGGALVLDFSNALWILRNFVGQASAALDGTTYRFERTYDAETGLNRGAIYISSPAQSELVLRHEIRLYTPVEVTALLREAGFRVERVDSDFCENRPVTLDTRYAQVIATPRVLPPRTLAVSSYQTSAPAELDLRWSPDEVEWLDLSITEILNGLQTHLSSTVDWETVRRYSVDDPYCGYRAAATLTRFFGHDISPASITFGAGVSSLLRDLSGLAFGSILAPHLAYPDFAAWAAAQGAETEVFNETTNVAALCERIDHGRPSLVQLERPTSTGELLSLGDVLAVGMTAAHHGSLLLIDESNANYLGPGESCAPLISQLDNLIVLRGLSKGYTCGGLRIGFAVASEPASALVRELVAPLQASEFAFRAALRLLDAGDIFNRLRARVREVKPELVSRLKSIGVDVVSAESMLPWVLAPDADGTLLERLARYGVQVKQTGRPASGGTATQQSYLRISVPLSDQRLHALRSLLPNGRE